MSNEPDHKVIADVRENFGKGFARRLRAAGKIPAVIYGHGTEPVHVALPGHQVALLIRRANALLTIVIDGKDQLTLVKDVQKDPVHQIIEHIDLIVVKKGEKVQVDIPVTVVGEPAAGMNVNQHAVSVLLEVEATHIPQGVEADVEGLEEGAHITAADLSLPKGASLAADPELLIVAISAPSAAAEETDATPAEGEALDTQAEEAAE
ncbi:50S ribosomal protein L25/general stress protein Ctc [Microbacterium marmarense]|uniref:Large ribosomal subunit protein bL25 n=1 Tax=Microbacterium marmarense TaxID=3122051 RepID=A0ABU8LUL8_9MICO